MKNYIVLFLTLICFMSCIETTKSQDTKVKNTSMQNLQKTEEAQSIVQKILDIPGIQWMYHSEDKERVPIKILATNEISENLILTKFQKRVSVLSASEIKNTETKAFVALEYHKIDSDTLQFKLAYAVEGVVVNGKMILQNGTWNLLNYDVIEQ